VFGAIVTSRACGRGRPGYAALEDKLQVLQHAASSAQRAALGRGSERREPFRETLGVREGPCQAQLVWGPEHGTLAFTSFSSVVSEVRRAVLAFLMAVTPLHAWEGTRRRTAEGSRAGGRGCSEMRWAGRAGRQRGVGFVHRRLGRNLDACDGLVRPGLQLVGQVGDAHHAVHRVFDVLASLPARVPLHTTPDGRASRRRRGCGRGARPRPWRSCRRRRRRGRW